MNLSEVKKDGFVARKIIVYGPPKSGKTELVGALASAGYKLWYFDADNGIKTLLRPDSAAKSGLERIVHIPLPDTQSYPIAHQTISRVLKGNPEKICYLHGTCSCFVCMAEEKKGVKVDWALFNLRELGPKDIMVVDSISQFVSSTMNDIVREQVKKNDDYKPDWDDWRKQGFLLDRAFGIIQAGTFNFIGISHEEQQKLESGQTRIVPVGGTGNFSKTFAKYWDDLIYTDVVNGGFKVYSQTEAGVNAIVGSRAGKKITTATGLIELFK